MIRVLILILAGLAALTLQLVPIGTRGDGSPAVELSRPALYGSTHDANDASQLIDGEVANGTMWLSTKAVGWYADGRPITITLRYPDKRAGDRVCLHLAQRPSADALLPRSIDVFGSGGKDQALRWLGAAHPPDATVPDSTAYSTHDACIRFAPSSLATVQVVIAPRGPYLFIDEAELSLSRTSRLNIAPAQASEAIAAPVAFALRRNELIERLRAAKQSEAGADGTVPANLLTALEASEAGRDPAALDEIARAIGRWRVRAAATGNAFELSAVDPFAPASALDPVAPLAEPVLLIAGGQMEIAAASLLPVDARGGRFEVNFAILGAPEGAFVTSLAAPTDVSTAEGTTVADPLHPLAGAIEVPTGFQQTVWASVRASTTAPVGTFPARMTVRDLVTGASKTVGWTIRSEHFTPGDAFPSVAWAYLDKPPLVRASQSAAQDLLDHGVNVAVLPPSLAPWPVARDRLAPAPDYRASDRALATFASSQQVLVFLGFKGEDFSTGQRLGTPTPPLGPDWNRRFSAWITAWAAHLRARGFGPERIAFYPVDEPGSARERALFIHIATLIRQAVPDARIYTTLRQTDGVDPAFLGLVNVVQLDEATFKPEFARKVLAAGKQTWLYTAEKTGKAADPATVYRALAWRAIAAGLSGAGVWSYSQNGDEGSPWDDLDGAESDRAMVYPEPGGSWLSSRRWEAWRMGNQDAAVLQAALKRAAAPSERAHIRQLAAAGATAQRDPSRLLAIRSELLALARPR